MDKMQITETEFVEKFGPIQNPYTKEGSWNNTLFETYGVELSYVRCSNFNDKQIWTLIDSDYENTYIIPGYSIVNRSGYFITEVPWDDANIEVNCNEMVTKEKAINLCINFFKSLKFKLDRNSVRSFFSEEDLITIGEAKYTAIDYWESLGNELTTVQENKIHDYYAYII